MPNGKTVPEQRFLQTDWQKNLRPKGNKLMGQIGIVGIKSGEESRFIRCDLPSH
ncbi:hypothetical protein [Paenibacillus aestuarii]|uniref:Uncharacterized protein n=1 Tax=Paenibacillus aestuarii TaxID=516965 RepID=A0ABW0K335_9BACL|nr:hypothetical protein [Paenibacillus aestuarii]